MKLFKDFGVRALLAVISIICYEAILIISMVILWRMGNLDTQTALMIGSSAQTPALMALGFYFTTRSGSKPPDDNNTTPGTTGAA